MSDGGGSPHDRLLELLLSSAGLFTLFYCLGFLARRAFLNMLGAPGELFPLGARDYADEALRFALVGLVPVCLLAAAVTPVMWIADRIARVLGWRLSVASGPLGSWRVVTIIALCVSAVRPAVTIAGFRDLLSSLGPGAAGDRPSALWCAVVFSEWNIGVLLGHLVAVLVLLATTGRLVAHRAWRRGVGAAAIVTLCVGALVAGGWIVAQSYGMLGRPCQFRPATIEVAQAPWGPGKVAGYPIMQTGDSLLFYRRPLGAAGGSMQVIKRATWRMRFTGGLESPLEGVYEMEREHCASDAIRGELARMTITQVVAGLAAAALLFMSSSRGASTAQANEKLSADQPATGASATTTATPAATLPVAATLTAARAAASVAERENSVVRQLEPYFAVLQGVGEGASRLLQDLLKLTLGGGGTGGAEVADGDIWRFDFDDNGSLLRLTADGGYSSARASPDGSEIAFIRGGALGVMPADGGGVQVIDGQAGYRAVLGWHRVERAFLCVTADRALVVVRVDGSQQVVSSVPTELVYRTAIAASSLSERGTELHIDARDDRWQVEIDRADMAVPKLLISLEHKVYDASWLPDEVGALLISGGPSAGADD